MVKNDIFESVIKLCSANYARAPSGAQNRAKLSVKIVKVALQLRKTTRIFCPYKARDRITPSEAKIKILYV